MKRPDLRRIVQASGGTCLYIHDVMTPILESRGIISLAQRSRPNPARGEIYDVEGFEPADMLEKSPSALTMAPFAGGRSKTALTGNVHACGNSWHPTKSADLYETSETWRWRVHTPRNWAASRK